MELRPGGVGHARTSPTLVVPDELPETTLAETRLDRSQDVWHVLAGFPASPRSGLSHRKVFTTKLGWNDTYSPVTVYKNC